MSLTLNETFRVNAPPDRVWRFLKNPADVVTCLPGAELTDTIDAQTYAGRVKVKVGPITAAYAGKATLTQVDDAARRMQIVAEGKESGGAGSARMTMEGFVAALPDGTSNVSVDATIDIAGRVMQFGRGLIESVNKQLFRQFADSVRTKLEHAHAAESGNPDGPAGSAASATEPGSSESNADGISGTSADGSPPPVDPPGASPAEPAAAARTAAPRAPIARGEDLRALPLLWKVFTSWLSGLFRRRR